MNTHDERFDTVTVFGGSTMDRAGHTDAAPVMGASNPGRVRTLPGGVGFNVATILARLGVGTRLVTRVGPDLDGETVIAAARAAGVDTATIGVSAAAPTGTYHAAFDNTGDLIIGIADMKVCDEIVPSALGDLLPRPRDFWVVDANLPGETIAWLATEAGAAGRPIAALTVSPAKAARLVPVLDRLSYVFANRREALVLSGRDTNDPTAASDLAAALATAHSLTAIVTDGAEPLAVAEGGAVRSFAPLRAIVKGVNGAGDSLAAGTIRGLTEGLAIYDAICGGLAAAVLTLEAGCVGAARFAPGALEKRAGPDVRIAS